MTAKAAGKVVKQLAGSGTGQSLMDRVTQAKYSLAGSGLGKVVAKATTEEIGAPKKKHIDYLINCSNEPNVSIPLLAGLLVERTQEKSWVIVFKALITTHNLMNFGNEKFSHYLASNNCPLNLPNFNDKTSAQSYEMSLFIRKYSKYMCEKVSSYRAMAFDFCKVKRGRDDGVLRKMPVDKLLKALPVMQSQIMTLLEFDAMEKDLNNVIINAVFLLLYKDLIRLFASYNEGMINLIEKYFTLKRRQCRLGLDLYHEFPGLLSKLTEFLTLAEHMGIGDKDSLGLQPVPPKVIQAMEQHLQILESKKGSDDEDDLAEHVTTTTTTKPNVPKKPALPITVPVDKYCATATTTTTKSQTESKSEPIKTEQIKQEPIQSNDTDNLNDDDDAEGEADSSCPSVVVNDIDGLPTALQEEVIAAATSYLGETVTKSTEAVKRSAQQNAVPIHTQLGRSEQRTVAITSPQKSRSPSPARPTSRPGNVTTGPDHSAQSDKYMGSASDSETPDNQQAEDQESLEQHKLNLSTQDLNNIDSSQRMAASVSGSSLNADDAANTTDTTKTNEKTVKTTSEQPIQQQPTKHSALDDLFGLDMWTSEPTPGDSLQPTPIAATVVNSSDVNADTSVIQTNEANNNNDNQALNDILALDPLLGGADDSASSSTPINKPATDPSGLPAGLKPVQSNIPIRPAAVSNKQKDALDSLDSTLSNLASSLGGQTNWGK